MNVLKKLKINKVIAVLMISLGLVLMFIKIDADSEPGAIPILLLVLGTGWYFITQSKSKMS